MAVVMAAPGFIEELPFFEPPCPGQPAHGKERRTTGLGGNRPVFSSLKSGAGSD